MWLSQFVFLPMKYSFLLLSLVLLSVSGTKAAATSLWTGAGAGDSWFTDENWSNDVPDSTTEVQFGITAASPDSSVTIVIDANESAVGEALRTGPGRTTEIQFGDQSSLTLSLLNRQGVNNFPGNTGSGDGTLLLTGPATGSATLDLGTFYVNVNDNTFSHHLVIDGNLTVNDISGSHSIVGRLGADNTWTVQGGAQVTRHALWLGNVQSDGAVGNQLVVAGGGSSMIINGGSGNRILRVGQPAGASYAEATRDNAVYVQDGGQLTVTTPMGGSTNSIWIGNAASTRSNYVLVEDAGSRIDLLEGSTLVIGNAAGSNLGGNHFLVRNGGVVQGTGTTTIHRFDETGQNDGANRLIVGEGGTFQTSGNFDVRGTLELHETGVIQSQNPDGSPTSSNILVREDGRTELSGTGLDSSVTLQHQAGSVLAVGQSGASGPAAFTLNSSASMEAGSAMEFGIFSSTTSDQLFLNSGALLTLSESGQGVALEVLLEGYDPVAGDSWSLFAGETATGLVGDFSTLNLPSLTGTLDWDVTGFSESGGWTLSVIPEPSAGIYVALASLTFLTRRSGRSS